MSDCSSEINDLFREVTPDNVQYDQMSDSKSPTDMENEVAVLGICKQPAPSQSQHIENDIETTVTEFLDEFSTCFSTQVTGNAFITRKLQDKLMKISQWIGTKLQVERDGWANKLKMAMQEIESQRKSALLSLAVIQECSEELHLLLECFNVSDSVLKQIPTTDQRVTLRKEVEILVEVCNGVMEDRFQCMQILGITVDTTTSLADVLGYRITKMQTELKNLEINSAELQKSLEAENLKLFKEITKMKKLISKKQEDIEMFQEQLVEINKIVYGQSVCAKEPNQKSKNDGEIIKSQIQIHNSLKNISSSQNINQTKYTSFIKHSKISSSTPNLDTIHQIEANNPSLQSMSNLKLLQNKQCKSQGSITASTQTSVLHANFPPMIQISEEKLEMLKQRAKKLEDSLHDAITSMEMLRRTAKTTETLSTTSSSDPAPLNKDKWKKGQVEALENEWKKATFEINGAPTKIKGASTASVSSYDVLPKLNKLRDPSKRRCQSERAPPPVNDSLRTVHRPPPSLQEESTDTLSKLRAYHRPKNGLGKVSKCFRCQKLFRTTDNHKLACCFHSKGKERAEKYSEGGQLVKVTYIWKCCNQELDSDGCCTGQHL